MTGAQDRHSAHPSAGSALVPPNLPHFCAAYGRLVRVFKPAGRASNGAPCQRA